MKTPIFSLLAAAGFLTLVSCTNLASSQNPNSQYPNYPNHKINPQVSDSEKQQVPENTFAADVPLDPNSANSHILLDAVLERISELPTDGKFGLSRVYVSTHGFPYKIDMSVGKDGLNAYETLTQTHLLSLKSWSSDRNQIYSPRTFQVAIPNNANINYKDITVRSAVQKATMIEDPTELRSFINSSADSLQIIDKSNPQIILELRKSYATSPKCYSCHKGIMRGEPIGIIGIKRVPLESIPK